MKYIWIEQQDSSDCGPACLVMIGRYYGKRSTITYIREKSKTNKYGTTVKGLMDGAKSMGLNALAGQYSFDKEIDIKTPCVMHVVKDEHFLHYVVLWEVTKTSVIISDPAEGIIELSKQMFLSGNVCSAQSHLYQWNGVALLFFSTKDTKNYLPKEKRIVKEFFHLILEKKVSYSIVLLSVLSTILNIIIVFFLQLLIDKIIPEGNINNSLNILIVFLLIVTAKVIFDWTRVQQTLLFNKEIHSGITYKFYEHLLQLPQNFFDHRTTGELVSRLQDINIIQDLLAQIVLSVFVDVLSIVISTVVLYKRNKVMFLMILFECSIYFFIVIIFKNQYAKSNKIQLENEANLTSTMVEGLSGNSTIKIYTLLYPIMSKLKNKLNDFWSGVFEVTSIENTQYAIRDWISNIGQLLLLWIGGGYVIQGKLTLGELVMFNVLSAYLLTPVRNLVNLQAQVQTAIVAYKRTQEIMELNIEESGIEQKKLEIQGDIEFENIDFRYDMQSLIFESMSIKIPQNEKTVIIGDNGTGKSTIAKLIMRLYSPEEGKIKINGQDINNYSLQNYRKKIAYVPQDAFLFTGTIEENLTMGIDKIGHDKIKKVCEVVGIHDFIMSLPFQYQTMIGENGINISGGQKQKIALARAVLRDTKILILDEPTSNIDEKSELKLWENLFDYLKECTVIIIAHKSCVISKCDNIFVIRNKKVVQIKD